MYFIINDLGRKLRRINPKEIKALDVAVYFSILSIYFLGKILDNLSLT